ATSPQTAIWHFGWHVTDTRASLETYQARPDVTLLPLYTTDDGGSVLISSDTWPSTGPTPGLTRAQIAEARARGTQPTRKGAVGRGRVRRRGPALVHASGRPAASELTRPRVRPRRPQRFRSRRLDRQAATRARHVSRRALQARRHARGDDRGPEPRGAGAGRGRVAARAAPVRQPAPSRAGRERRARASSPRRRRRRA